MCGISGVYARQISDQQRGIIQAVMESQFARGPDHQAMISLAGENSQVVLAHNRLSIIDLSEQANQPMWDAKGRYCITYNGEIYNYLELRQELKSLGFEFHTQSDTEVILNAFSCWGIEALERFRGPFAFALFDKQSDTLWLCRDRFAVRPLYYLSINQSLYFASSTAVLAKALNLKPNLAYVAKGLKYLVYEDGSELAPYETILSLPAGSYLQAKLNSEGRLSETIKVYYDLTSRVESLIEELPVDRIDLLLERISVTLEEAVKLRLRTDVPLAISLSSGLDSSTVAAMVSKAHHDTIGFSFGHPQHKKTEGPLVAKCARFLDMKIEYVWPTAAEMIEGLDQTLTAQDAPFASLSIVAQYLLYKRVRACGVKVLLGGAGWR